MARPFYTIQLGDVGRIDVRGPDGRLWYLRDCLGRVQLVDVGKRVYEVAPGVLQAENDAQRAERLKGKTP